MIDPTFASTFEAMIRLKSKPSEYALNTLSTRYLIADYLHLTCSYPNRESTVFKSLCSIPSATLIDFFFKNKATRKADELDRAGNISRC